MRQKIVMMVKEGEIHIMCVSVTRKQGFCLVLKNCVFHCFSVKMTSITKRIAAKGTLITTFILIPNQGSRQALQDSLKKSYRPLI
jgi:hypothetical protein